MLETSASTEKESVSQEGLSGTEVMTHCTTGNILLLYFLRDITVLTLLCRRILLSVAYTMKPANKSTWCKARSTEWWRGVMTGLYGEEWWRENLRMTRSTFEIVCYELRPEK